MESFGLYYKGWPPLDVHEFLLLHERIDPDLNQETKPEDWVIRDKAPVPTRHLLWDKQHDFLIPGVEFLGGMKANILLNARFLSRKPIVSTHDREGKFFEVMKPLIHGAVIATASLIKYKEGFSEASVQERTAFTDDILAILNLNNGLVDQTGQEMISVVVSRHDPVTKEQERLLQAETEAKIRRKVARIEAAGDVADVTEMTKALKLQFRTADPSQILEMVRDIAVAQRIKESGLQAVGAGGIVSLTGNSKKPGGKTPGKGGRKP